MKMKNLKDKIYKWFEGKSDIEYKLLALTYGLIEEDNSELDDLMIADKFKIIKDYVDCVPDYKSIGWLQDIFDNKLIDISIKTEINSEYYRYILYSEHKQISYTTYFNDSTVFSKENVMMNALVKYILY